MPSLVVCVWLAWLCHSTNAQLAWTPIYVTGKSQIDLWTQEAKGCSCPWYASDNTCACCVTDGGCHCGKDAPNRCTQCGLEQHCNHMCNVTIVSSELYSKSGKTFGQIKLPSIEGPTFCWYTFEPTSFQRVEVQIYRIGNIGKHTPTGCSGGYVQLINGVEPMYSSHDYQLCGANERYSPPVVFFMDDGNATLLLEISETTSRSQFLAYFSFSAKNNTDGLGFQPRGGMRLQNTDCDWLYQDFECDQPGKCVLASPGYPGVYPPFRQCKYHISAKSENTQVRITFTAMLLLQSHCKTDYIAIYKGTATSSTGLIEKFCGNQRKRIELYGQNLLIVFSSGAQVPPFDYNGFVAHLDFYEKKTTTEMPTTTSTAKPIANERATTSPVLDVSLPPNNFTGCEILISGNNTRSGHFDTREHDWYHICRLSFKGRPTDVVHISLYNYRLKSPMCKTVVEIFDGPMEYRKNLIEKLCSPQDKQGRDKNRDSKKIFSTGNEMVIYFQRPTIPQATSEAEFIAGRYFFHDEQISGTIQPQGMCDVLYRGNTSPVAGIIDNPGTQHLYWDMEGTITCRQKFIPAANQSIMIEILGLDGMSSSPACVTQCGDNGCLCSTEAPLQKLDHILLVNEEGWNVACLCGDIQQEELPVSVRSWGALTLVYSVAQYTWKNKGFKLTGSYAFNSDSVCGEQVYTVHTGEISLKNLTPPENLNNFYEQNCMWTLLSNVERQLELEITSKQNRPCTAWNISVHEFSPSSKHNLGDLLHNFCSRDNVKAFMLPWKLNTVIVRLRTLSRALPEFKIKWRSQVVRANTRYGGPTPVPNAISCANCSTPCVFVLLLVFFVGHKLHILMESRTLTR